MTANAKRLPKDGIVTGTPAAAPSVAASLEALRARERTMDRILAAVLPKLETAAGILRERRRCGGHLYVTERPPGFPDDGLTVQVPDDATAYRSDDGLIAVATTLGDKVRHALAAADAAEAATILVTTDPQASTWDVPTACQVIILPRPKPEVSGVEVSGVEVSDVGDSGAAIPGAEARAFDEAIMRRALSGMLGAIDAVRSSDSATASEPRRPQAEAPSEPPQADDDVLPITGTWMDFHHCNPYEGDYWNDATRAFTATQWSAKVEEMAAAGMDTLVVLSVALNGRAFYPSTVLTAHWNLLCPDPLEAVLEAADRCRVRVYLGAGFFTTPAFHDFGAAAETAPRRDAILDEVTARYGHHPSFVGWYLPVEAGIREHFPDGFIDYVNRTAAACRARGPSKVLIAPYGTRSIRFDTRFRQELAALDVDHIAYQDEIGVGRAHFDEVSRQFEQLRAFHADVDADLWADLETFRFEGKRLVPAPFSRIRRQMETLSPFVEKIICYQYWGLMNAPGTPAYAGHPASVTLYRDYRRYLGGRRRGVDESAPDVDDSRSGASVAPL